MAPTDERPGDRQCHRPGELRSLRGVARRPAQLINDHPDLGDIIVQTFIARRQLASESGEFVGVRVIGSRYSRDTFRVREFLAKNRVPFTWFDLEADSRVKELLKRFGVSQNDTPVVTWGNKLILRNPSDHELADALGIRRPLQQTTYDLVVVGAGPAGLAAAVYAAPSEGLNTGRAGTRRAGWPGRTEHAHRELPRLPYRHHRQPAPAERAALQANKFGAQISVPTPATALTFDQAYSVLQLDGQETIVAKCVLIATGADYRRPWTSRAASGSRAAASLAAATPIEAPDVPGRRGGGRRRCLLRRPGRRLPGGTGPEAVPGDPW